MPDRSPTDAARAAHLASLDRLSRDHGVPKPAILKAAHEIAKRKPVGDRMNVGEG